MLTNKNYLSRKLTEGNDMMDVNALTGQIIGAAIEVHKPLDRVFWNQLMRNVFVAN